MIDEGHMRLVVRTAFVVGIAVSIAITYQSKIVNEDFEIFTNSDGLPELDE